MTKETKMLIQDFCSTIILNKDIQSVEEYLLLLNQPKSETIIELKESCKKIYYDNINSNYRIDQYGNAIEEDGSITSYEKLMVLCNMYLRNKYFNGNYEL